MYIYILEDISVCRYRDMKKYIILATAALALAACSNEEENVQAWNGEISLSAVRILRSLSNKR